MGWRNFLLTTEGSRFFVICRANSLTDEALLVGHWHIGRNLAGTLTILQFFSKELLSGLEVITIGIFLLVGYEVKVSVGFFLNGRLFEHADNLMDKQIGRATVEH